MFVEGRCCSKLLCAAKDLKQGVSVLVEVDLSCLSF